MVPFWSACDLPAGEACEPVQDLKVRHTDFKFSHQLTIFTNRKMALCALETSDSYLVKYCFYQLPEEGRSDPSTTYLMYKLSLKDEDIDSGRTEESTFSSCCL